MRENYHNFPKAFYYNYVNELSADTFGVLFRLYGFYLEKSSEDKKSITIQKSEFIKTILFDTGEQLRLVIFKELEKNGLIQYEDGTYIDFNVSKIFEDGRNEPIKTKKVVFRINIIDDKKSEDVIKTKIIQEIIDNFIDRFPKYMHGSLKKTIDGIVIYLSHKNKPVRAYHISQSINDFLVIENDVILKLACEKYNNHLRYGRAGSQYVVGIAKKLIEQKVYDIIVEKQTEKQEHEDHRKKESEKLLGVALATGKLMDEDYYKTMVENKKFNRLKQLYDIGIEILKKQDKEKEIFKDYEWLK